MKNHNRLCLCFLALCWLLISCKNQTNIFQQISQPNPLLNTAIIAASILDKGSNPMIKYEPVQPISNIKVMDNDTTPIVKITSKTAKDRIDRYLHIYGSNKQFWRKGSKRVLLPRYFIIQSNHCSSLLAQEQSGDGRLYASFNVKMQDNVPVCNLIFHNIQPNNADGSLNSAKKASDYLFDFGNACPTDCKTGTGENASNVTYSEAVARIKAYNDIYGDANAKRYIINGTDKILIPRYYSFSKQDIIQVLASMTKNETHFYVSLGAEGSASPYISDLIFHHLRPNDTGKLSSQEIDSFFDVTRPCPSSCPDPPQQ